MDNLNNDFEVRLATLAALEGDMTKTYANIFEVDKAILKKIEEGGGGGAQIDDNNVSTGTVWSSFKTNAEIFNKANDYLILVVGETFTQDDLDKLNSLLRNYSERTMDHIYIKSGSDLSHTYYKCLVCNGGTYAYMEVYAGTLYVHMITNLSVGTVIEPSVTYEYNNKGDIAVQLTAKQNTLVSGTNIKTINNLTILGAGNIDIQGGGGAGVVELTQAQYDALAVKDPSTIYNITDATPYVMEDYVAKTALDSSWGTLATTYNPYNTTTPYSTASTGYFVSWNSYGQIVGKGSYAYQKNLTINGSQHTLYGTSSTAFPNIYAPTSAGTAGQILLSNGSGSPQWVNFKSDATAYISESDCSAGTYSNDISTFYRECIAANHIGPMQLVNSTVHNVKELDQEVSSMETTMFFAVENGTSATILVAPFPDFGVIATVTINADGTISDPDQWGKITTETSFSILGYNVYKFTYETSYNGYVKAGNVYSIKDAQHTSYSYYYPSSTRLYENYIEIWFFTTENGTTWRNFHVTIDASTVTADVTTGTFGA